MLCVEKPLQSPAISRILIVGRNSEIPRAAFTLADAKARRKHTPRPTRVRLPPPEWLRVANSLEKKLPIMPSPDDVPGDLCAEVEVTWAECGLIRAAIAKAEGSW